MGTNSKEVKKHFLVIIVNPNADDDTLTSFNVFSSPTKMFHHFILTSLQLFH